MQKKALLLISILSPGVLIIIYTIGIYYITTMEELKKSLGLINIGALFFLSLLFVLTKKLLNMAQKEVELEVVKSEFKNVELLINTLRQQRHDHANHIQTVNSMLHLQEIDDAKKYLAGISKSYHNKESVIRLGNPTLTALINAKNEFAGKYKIDLRVLEYEKMTLEQIKPWDLSSVLGNLIDNAIDYLVVSEIIDKVIELSFTKEASKSIIEISNPLQKEDLGIDVIKIFEQGYSSKSSVGRGYGLYIVKQILDKYDCKCQVNIAGNKICFRLIL